MPAPTSPSSPPVGCPPSRTSWRCPRSRGQAADRGAFIGSCLAHRTFRCPGARRRVGCRSTCSAGHHLRTAARYLDLADLASSTNSSPSSSTPTPARRVGFFCARAPATTSPSWRPSRRVAPCRSRRTPRSTPRGARRRQRVDLAGRDARRPDGMRALPVFSGIEAVAAWTRPSFDDLADQAVEGCGSSSSASSGRGSCAPRWCGHWPNSVGGCGAHRPVRLRRRRHRRAARRTRHHGIRDRGGQPARARVLGVVLDLR